MQDIKLEERNKKIDLSAFGLQDDAPFFDTFFGAEGSSSVIVNQKNDDIFNSTSDDARQKLKDFATEIVLEAIKAPNDEYLLLILLLINHHEDFRSKDIALTKKKLDIFDKEVWPPKKVALYLSSIEEALRIFIKAIQEQILNKAIQEQILNEFEDIPLTDEKKGKQASPSPSTSTSTRTSSLTIPPKPEHLEASDTVVDDYIEIVLGESNKVRPQFLKSFQEFIEKYFSTAVAGLNILDQIDLPKELEEYEKKLVLILPRTYDEFKRSYYAFEIGDNLIKKVENMIAFANELHNAANRAESEVEIKRVILEEKDHVFSEEKLQYRKNLIDQILGNGIKKSNNVKIPFAYQEQLSREKLEKLAGTVDPHYRDENGCNFALLAIKAKNIAIYRFLVEKRKVDAGVNNNRGYSAYSYQIVNFPNKESQLLYPDLESIKKNLESIDAVDNLLQEMHYSIQAYMKQWKEKYNNFEGIKNYKNIFHAALFLVFQIGEKLFNTNSIFLHRRAEAEALTNMIEKARKELPISFFKDLKAISSKSNWGALGQSRLMSIIVQYAKEIEKKPQYVYLINPSEYYAKKIDELSAKIEKGEENNKALKLAMEKANLENEMKRQQDQEASAAALRQRDQEAAAQRQRDQEASAAAQRQRDQEAAAQRQRDQEALAAALRQRDQAAAAAQRQRDQEAAAKFDKLESQFKQLLQFSQFSGVNATHPINTSPEPQSRIVSSFFQQTTTSTTASLADDEKHKQQEPEKESSLSLG